MIRPTRDRCLVLLDEKVAMSAGGIAIPDLIQDQPTTGVVIAVGSECTAVAVGDKVAFGKWNGWEVPANTAAAAGYEGKSLWLMRPITNDPNAPHVAADHIHAIIEEEEV